MTVPTLPAPVVPPEPEPPVLDLPEVLVLTAFETSYYAEVCDSYGDIRDGDSDARQELQAKTGLSEQDACKWAVYGFTVQDWLTVEVKMAEIAGYVEQLRAQIEFLKRLMEERQRVMDQHVSALQEIGPLKKSVPAATDDDRKPSAGEAQAQEQ